MTAGNWQLIYTLFERALDEPPEARAALLDGERAAKPEMVAEVERLLRLAESSGDFLERGLDLGPAHMPPSGEAATFSPGDRVGNRFVIKRLIGSGGMGEVYLAFDEELEVEVALKSLRLTALPDRAAQEQLRREALLARQVTHPNVCRIHDVCRHVWPGGQGELVVLAMEFLDGMTLREHLDRHGRLGEVESLDIARQLCEGLDAAHRQGIVHRDFKPANVILVPGRPGPRAVITDFGLALPNRHEKGLESGVSARQSGPLWGTADYMAPELLRGRAASAHSDIYSLGIVLFEMTTGKQPYPGAGGLDQLLARFLDPTPSPRRVFPGLGRKWDEAIRACLAREPEKRPASAKTVAAKLEGGRAQVSRRTLLIGGSIAASGAGAGVWLSRERPVTVVLAAIDNQSGNADLRYVAQGATAEIARQLVGLDGIRVVRFDGSKPDLRRLPGEFALAGSLQDGGNLTLELTETRTGRTVWSNRFEGRRYEFDGRRYKDPLRMQSDVTAAVVPAVRSLQVAGVRRALFPASVAASPAPQITQSAEAFQAYLEASNLMRDRDLRVTRRAIALLQRALQLDPRFALAYAGMAEAIVGRIDTADGPIAELLLEGYGFAERSVREGPMMAECHAILAQYRQMMWDWDGARVSFLESLRLRPNYSRARQWFAGMRLQFGTSEEILEDMRRALAEEPFDQLIRNGCSMGLFFAGRYEESIQVIDEAAHVKNVISARHQIGAIYAYQGFLASGADKGEFFRRALEEAAAARTLEDRPEAPAGDGARHSDRMYSLFYALAGDERRAAPFIARLEEGLDSGKSSPAVVARAYAALGQTDHALDLIELGMKRKDRGTMYLKTNPFFRVLHREQRFQQFLRTMRL